MEARASDAAYAAIKTWIQLAQVPPGSLIDEDEAARRLTMSRTPVREALLRLQSEGFVEIGRGKGIRVVPLSASDMRDIYQVITGIEVVAVSLLGARCTKREISRASSPLLRRWSAPSWLARLIGGGRRTSASTAS